GKVREYYGLRRSFPRARYLAANRDVAAAGLHPLVHYIEHGAREDRALEPPRRAVEPPRPPKRKVLLVGHDAHLHGAQMIILNVAETLKNQFGCEVACLLLRDGALAPRFGQLGRVYVANDDPAEMQAAI